VDIRKFWIRKDRESYFLNGVIITCAIASFVSSYWHFEDRLTVKKRIDIKTQAPTEVQQKKLREVQYISGKMNIGATRYYQLDDETRPSVPKLGEDE
jgi:hypothetical protein